MAEDTRDPTTASTSIETTSPAPPKKFPKGVVLGKDGKPCRTCTSFADWAAQTKKSTRSTTTSNTSALPSLPCTNPPPPTGPPPDCPPDVETLGRSTWTLLHALSASYPTNPSASDKSNMATFLSLFAKLYPCWVCAEDFQSYMAREEVRVESRAEFGQWMCEAHNEVNRKLGKEEFDCKKWEERWRTGWGDGRCD